MKRIHFTELGFKKNFDTFIMILGVICLIIGLVAVFGFLNSRLAGLAGFSAVLTTFPQMRIYFYKNYFIWNKRGGQIKVNSKSKRLIFNEIASFQLENNNLILLKKNNSHLEFQLNDINQDDIKKLEQILKTLIKN